MLASSDHETTTVHSAVSDPDDPHIFLSCRWKVDDRGCLHIFRAPSGGSTVMVAAFGAGSWFMVHADAEVIQQ